MDILTVLSRWWSRKYTLPRNHPLFEESCIGDLLEEWYTDHYRTLKEIEDLIDAGSLAESTLADLQVQRNAVRGVLGMRPTIYTGDVVIDYFETELAAGRDPPLGLKAREVHLLIEKREREDRAADKAAAEAAKKGHIHGRT